MNIKNILSERVSAAMVAAGLPEGTNPALVYLTVQTLVIIKPMA